MERRKMISAWIVTLTLTLVLSSVSCSAPVEGYEFGVFRREHMNLTEVPSDIPRGARAVYLTGNKITAVRAKAFSNLTRCALIDLSYNPISEIDTGAFTGLTKLRNLVLHENELDAIRADMWNGLTSLQILEVTGSGIQTLPSGAFAGLDRLTTLHMQFNELTEIRGDSLEGLSSLKEIHMAFNKIRTFHSGAFVNLQRLTTVGLQYNNITTLSAESFRFIPSHQMTLMLSGNPLQCDRSMCWLKEAEREGLVVVADLSYLPLECATHGGARWKDVDIDCDEQ